MIVLCVTLLLLHQGYTKIPVATSQLGEPVTLTCIFPEKKLNFEGVSWYKQNAGDNLKLIATKVKHTNPDYGPEFSEQRVDLKVSENCSSLTILETNQDDEGMYHCGVRDFTEIQPISWSGTYLSLKGNTQRTSNYTVVQLPSVSDPVRRGDLINLQCSILFDSRNKVCPENHSVFWFKSGSNKSHPDIIYTDGNRHEECNKRPDTQKSCVYSFPKKIGSSDDDGTYYCAVATCGEIIFGNGAKVKIEQTASFEFKALLITIILLVVSVIANIVFICYVTSGPTCKRNKGKQSDKQSDTSKARRDDSFQPVNDTTECGNDLNYAALRFSGGNAKRGRKKEELETEESVYSRVKC